MSAGLNAFLCGFVGAVSAHIVYVQANLYIVGDSIRLGRHPLYDPLAFDGLGLLWGLVVGVVCAVWLGAPHPAKAIFSGLGVTLAGVLAVGGVTTWQRYLALPVDPVLSGGPIEVHFELRLPPGRVADAGIPDQGEIGSGQRNIAHAELEPASIQQEAGRLVLPGRVRVRSAKPVQLLQFLDPVWGWVSFDVPVGELANVDDEHWSDWIVPTNAKSNPSAEYDFQLRYRRAR